MSKIIVISVDDLAQWAGPSSAYSSQVLTPNIDRLLDAGVNFSNAYTPEAICNAARTATLSGLMPHNTGVHSNLQHWADHVTPEQTWPAVFLAEGYEVGGFGKLLHDNQIAPSLVQVMFSDYQRFEGYKNGHPATSLAQPLPDTLDESDMADTITIDYAIEFLEENGGDDFLLNVGLFKPHLSWVVPQKYFDLYPIEDIVVPGLDGDDLSGVPAFILDQLPERGTVPETIETAKEFMQGYLASVSYVDAQLGRLLDALEEDGLFDDTNIVLFSDHGFHLGDHDNTWGKFTLWEEAAKVPLIIKAAGNVNGGTQVDDIVNLVDVYPTIAEMAGLTPPDNLDGDSLLSLVTGSGPAEGDGLSITWMYGSALLRSDDFAYILYEDGSEELYDMIVDPGQTVNLALDPAYAATVAEQRMILFDTVPLVHVEGHADGSSGHDSFVLSEAGDSASGGLGNDLYFVNNSDVVITENAGEGTDTVFTSVSYAMSDNIEDVHVKDYVAGPLTIWGNGLNNYIKLDGHDQVAYGGDGDDIIHSTSIRTTIYGENGNDNIHGGYNTDTLSGGDGDDSIFSGGGADVMTGDAGNDYLQGGLGDSVLSGGIGDDVLKGGAGDEILLGGTGVDTIDGGNGADMINGGDGSDTINGGGGNDIIYADGAEGEPTEGPARSVFRWSQAPDPDDGSEIDEGDDLTWGFSQDTGLVTVDFTVLQQDDATTEFSSTENHIDGLDTGTLVANPNSSLESAATGPGTDVLYRIDFSENVDNVEFRVNDIDHLDNVTIWAWDADGNQIDVTLTAGGNVGLIDNDWIEGDDTAVGNGGVSDSTDAAHSLLVQIAGPVDHVKIIFTQDGTDASEITVSDVFFDTPGDTPEQARGDDIVDGGAGSDMIIGGAGDDNLFGGDGVDYLDGGLGNDVLDGGNGADFLMGNEGQDQLTGGRGWDVFFFQDGIGDHQILDFDANNNREDIDLSEVTEIVNFRDLYRNHLSVSGDNVVIDDGNGMVITLLEVDISDLSFRDFVF
ncbi:sulfatase-like hydrolase/transferase [Phaeobacter marinintestinus]|uniref:sulfatase-like hydrolase/transferase n=1 Tax=Falsiphaeobacter marinintestinus TaxID=1492905 RepID=UPI0011B6C4D7|nr:sulfatase-like hydrolase/transferase [Phaeobacter marinintestinus]